MKTHTPLYALSNAICKNNPSRLFYNQVIMYQLLVPFICDQLTSFSNTYSPASVDDLILDIRRFLICMYEHPGGYDDKEKQNDFSSMHRYIYDNLANRDSGVSFQPYSGDSSILSVTELRGVGNLESNISNTISDRRALPKKFIKLVNTDSEYNQLLYRCFWLLQYYFVYYAKKICSVKSDVNPEINAGFGFIEYFPLNNSKSINVYNSLKDYCADYSDYLCTESLNSIDLLSLSRIIIDIFIEQIRLRQKIQIDRIPDASVYSINREGIVTEIEQYAEYQNYINDFGSDSYDRLNMLYRFAPTNCYAADELASMYYWGKTFHVSDNNYYILEQSYEKAAEYFQMAIRNSNPPLKCSCWSLSYTLTNIRYDTEEERILAENKAIEYLKLAGDYPAAYGQLAWFLFRDGEVLYDKQTTDTAEYETMLIQFLSAIRLADQAGKMHWFYGNNLISNFLIKHRKDKKLLSDLSSRLELSIPFDLEKQLQFSAEYHNPWALKHLAIYYSENKRRSEAKALFEEAMKSNYGAAFYEAAVHMHKKGSSKWFSLMNKASELCFPYATYELALISEDEKEKRSLIEQCRQQIFSEKKLKSDLLKKINEISL